MQPADVLEEVWRPIDDYTGYQISDKGEVKGKRGQRRKLVLATAGYVRVALRKNKRTEIQLVHRLVALAFIPNPYNAPQVNHKNGVRNDNRAGNLEWVTAAENMQHRLYIPRTSQGRPVVQLLAGVPVRIWNTMSEAENALEIGAGTISGCCAGRLQSSGGFGWMCYDVWTEPVAEEEWRNVLYQGVVYQVSSMGRIKGRRGITMGTGRPGDYLTFSNIRVHRLVAEAFLAKEPGKETVNHKDGDRRNNHVDNLEWVTPRDNTLHAYSTGLTTHQRAVEQVHADGQTTIYYSIAEAARATGLWPTSILSACKGRYSHSGGFKWRYREES